MHPCTACAIFVAFTMSTSLCSALSNGYYVHRHDIGFTVEQQSGSITHSADPAAVQSLNDTANYHSIDWSENKRRPVWQTLRLNMAKQMDRFETGDALVSSLPVVPATLVYLLSEYEDSILKPSNRSARNDSGELNIHLIGASYLFEGLSDWKVLASTLPPYIRKVRVDLILGTPFQEDGPPTDAKGHRVEHEVGSEGQHQVPLLHPPVSLPQIGQEPYTAEGLRNMSCRTFTFPDFASAVIDVKCQEHLYQDVWNSIPKADLAFMVNPGFPETFRRSYDGVLQYLLKHSIPTAVSAQTNESDEKRQMGTGCNGTCSETDATSKTLQMFEAQTIFTPSPFPYRYQCKNEAGAVLKNSVIEFFVGRKPGSSPIKILPPMAEGNLSGIEDNEDLLASLRLPVSRQYAAAMTWLARGFEGYRGHLRTIGDWMRFHKWSQTR
eukprot:gnl/TRDRNA2_/TRDRNA2_174758_c2_seq3.p1 gnl/TRDRNA2_/TRDRNA2_174758_c2~~gnl/TRDRNA2_/TRDRNA2_174758_c2_seq3.p1  ORF type:complete len:438 (-),score=34.55 gnl/TRDRNA2_/TRDRNA2_174758_c2_seq3:75-1388(-)